MGVKNTYSINRKVAMLILSVKVHTASDEELEDMLKCLDESEFRNYMIGDNYENNHININSLEEFNNV